MKKSPNPYTPQSTPKNQVSRFQHGEARNDPSKKDPSSNSALKYIRAAAKEVVGFITLAFLFKQRKATSNAINNGQISEVSSKLLLFILFSILKSHEMVHHKPFFFFFLFLFDLFQKVRRKFSAVHDYQLM